MMQPVASGMRQAGAQGRAGSRPGLGLLAAALLLPVTASAVAADSGAPQGLALPIGPVQACLEGHFDPERYRGALEAAGWEVAAPEIRSDIVMRLADAFEPVAEARSDEEQDGAEQTGLRSANRAHWFSMTAQRTLMVRPGAVLFLTGLTADDGQRALECWVAMADPTVVEAIFAGALPESDEGIGHDEIAIIEYGPVPLEGQGRLRVMAARQAPAADSDDALSATHGFMTRAVFPPPD